MHGPTAAFVDVSVVPDAAAAGRRRRAARARARACTRARGQALHGAPLDAARVPRSPRASGSPTASASCARSSIWSTPSCRSRRRRPVELATWLGRVPDEHLAAFVTARAAMDDAPAPDDLEFPTVDGVDGARVGGVASRCATARCAVTVAIREDGEIGAFTELRVSSWLDARLHRRHGHRRRPPRAGARTGREGSNRCAGCAQDHPEVERRQHVERGGEPRRCASRQRAASASGRARPRRRRRSTLSVLVAQLRCGLRATQPDRPLRGPGLVRPARRALRLPLEPLQRPQAPDRRGGPRAALARPDHGLVPLDRARRRRRGPGRPCCGRSRSPPTGSRGPSATRSAGSRGLVDAKSREREAARAERGAAAAADPRRGRRSRRTSQLKKAARLHRAAVDRGLRSRRTRRCSRTRRARSTRASSIGAGSSDGSRAGSVVVEPIGGPDGRRARRARSTACLRSDVARDAAHRRARARSRRPT